MHVTRILLSIAASVLLATTAQAQHPASTSPLTLDVFEQKLHQTSQPQILDVRSSQEFSENHLKGAVNLNVSDSTAFEKGIASLQKTKPVFVYSINNGRSGVVAKKLRHRGFKEVYELPGGLAHWIGAGKPVESTAGKGLSSDDYQKLVASSNVVLVDVGSKYCGGCKKLEPVVNAIATEQGDLLKVVKIELYDNRELVKSLNIESVPTLILYKGNLPIWKKSGGNITKSEIQDALDNSL